MNKKIILVAALAFILIQQAAALDITEKLLWGINESSLKNFVTGATVTNNGANSLTNSLLGDGAYDFVPTDYQTQPDEDAIDRTTSIGVCMWINITTTDDAKFLINDDGWAMRTETDGSHGSCTAGNRIAIALINKATICTDGLTYTQNEFGFFCFLKNSSSVTTWLNGAKVGQVADANTLQVGTSVTYIMTQSAGGGHLQGQLDEAYVYSDLNQSVIDALYNNGTGCRPTAENSAGCSAGGGGGGENTTLINLTIQAVNGANGSNINTFNATVSQGSTTYNLNTSSGTITIELNSTFLANITLFGSNFLNTYPVLNWNVSMSFSGYLWESEARFNGSEIYTNTSITGFTVYGPYGSNDSSPPRLYFDDGTYSLNATKSLYQDSTLSITQTELENATETFIFYKFVNITAIDGKTGARISGLNVTVINTGIGLNYNNYTTGNELLIPVAASGTWNFTVLNNSYAPNVGNSQLMTVNASSSAIINLVFTLYTTNSFDITFLDEASLEVINTTTIRLDLISDLYSNNYSTSTGLLYIDALTPETYTFRYYGAGFQPRLSTFTLTEDTYNEITLYLLSGGENVSIYVYDQNLDPLESATVKIYRYSTASNSYILVNTINTDFEGKAVVNLQLSSEFYKFFIYYNGDLKKETAGAYVTGTEISFEINIGETVAPDFYNVQDLNGYLSFNDATRNFRFYYQDPNLAVTQGCLYVYTTGIGGETLYNSSCSASTSALILVNIANVTGQRYLAKGYVTIDGKQSLFSSLSYTFKEASKFGSLGILIIIILTLIFGFVAIWDIQTGLILMPLPTVIGSLPAVNWINIQPAFAIGLEIIFILMAAMIKRR